MKSAAATGPVVIRSGRIRVAGAIVLAALAVLNALELSWTERLRAALFDAYQIAAPRDVRTMPVTIVAIDQKSLSARGQWPWPRTLLAELVDAIAEARPAAVGIDILMPETDALSPERLLSRPGKPDAALANALADRPSNDMVLARALVGARAVLVVAGTPEATGMPLRAAPVSVRASATQPKPATTVAPNVVQYAGALTSIDVLDRAAAGWGLISVDPDRGVIRRIPLVASVDGTLVPALAIEMLRVAIGAPALRLWVAGSTVESIAIGDLVVPTEPDGAVRIHYSPHEAARFVSAIDVLDRKVDPSRLQRKLVLIGLTGLGLLDFQSTPSGERMPGSEIHAQLIENIYDQTLLRRPTWAPGLEAALMLILGTVLVWATPRWKPHHAALLMVACVVLPAAIAFAAYRTQRLLFDTATPALLLLLLFGVLLVLTLADATRQKKSLLRLVQAQREQSARIAGELEAARRIQIATLPRADVLRGDERIDIGATMVPARETGGDLYDFFRLEERRLFFLVGDVAGKGLSASIFMAVSKALYKSATLRTPGADMGELMSVANTEVSRDNPEMLFVTAFAGILDLDTGELAYCNAGHENPYLVDPTGNAVRRIQDGDGPPLCTVDDYAYRGAHCRMRRGELLCVITDGVTEALDPRASLFGDSRVQQKLRSLSAAATAQSIVDALRAEVEAFAAGAEPADDLTILALRWRGPRAADQRRFGR